MNNETPEINIPVLLKKELNSKLIWFVNNYENEVSGWLIGEFNEKGITVEDILIPEQEVGMAHVDTEGAALVKLRQEYGDRCKRIIGHWHSHNTMNAHWSSIDEDFIKTIIQPRDRFLFIVSSKSDGHLIRLELNKPFRLSVNKLAFNVEQDNKITKFCEDQIKKKVKETVYQPAKQGDFETVYPDNNTYPDQFEDLDSHDADLEEYIGSLIKYDKSNWNVKVGPLLWYKATELEKDFSHYTVDIDDKKTLDNFATFYCKTKKNAKKLMNELKLYFKDHITHTSFDEYRSYKQDYDEYRGHY